jgi:hypothetical protein
VRYGVPQALICIDAVGVGASTCDACRELKLPYIFPVIFSNKDKGTARSGLLTFANVRALAYWSLRDSLDPDHGSTLACLLIPSCSPISRPPAGG